MNIYKYIKIDQWYQNENILMLLGEKCSKYFIENIWEKSHNLFQQNVLEYFKIESENTFVFSFFFFFTISSTVQEYYNSREMYFSFIFDFWIKECLLKKYLE